MLVYLNPLSLFPDLHSDTIFGALTYAINLIFPEKVDSMIKEFETETPPFIVSSTFPYIYEDNEKIRFYPKIIIKKEAGLTDEQINIDDLKNYKKINFLEEEIFFKLLNGELTSDDIIKNYADYYNVKDLLLKNNNCKDFKYHDAIKPNNSINRLSNESEGVFYSEGREFKNLGLFFLIEFNNLEYEPVVKAAIKFLKDRGFGPDISTGKGQFDYEIVDYNISDENFSESSYFLTLSHYIPTNDELTQIGEDSSYEIGSKRGRSPEGELRKKVTFFKEGSIFKDYKKFYGRIIESGSNTPSVEYGFAFPLPFNKEVN